MCSRPAIQRCGVRCCSRRCRAKAIFQGSPFRAPLTLKNSLPVVATVEHSAGRLHRGEIPLEQLPVDPVFRSGELTDLKIH